ncbi:MAG: hypothetical protein WC346_11235 [Methanogenium sp.]|jgi:hypothetical protein
MATYTNKKLINPQLLSTTSGSVVYTVPTGVSAILTVISVTNTTSSNLQFDLHLCNQSEAASAANALIYNAAIDAHTTTNFNFGHVLSAGDVVRGSASASGLSLHMSGIEIST